MKYILIALAFIFGTSESLSAQVVVKLPTALILNQDAFELLPYPEDVNPNIGVPYESGVAFWRENGTVIEIVSHCTETPGIHFGSVGIGDEIQVTFSDNSTQTITVYEIIAYTYESQSNPLGNDFIANGIHYTIQEVMENAMYRDGYVLRSSRCSQGLAIGQYFIFAHITPIE